MKKIKNFKTVLGVVIVGLTTLLPSCVQGDFSELYDEDEALLQMYKSNRTKFGLEGIYYMPDNLNGTKGCGLNAISVALNNKGYSFSDQEISTAMIKYDSQIDTYPKEFIDDVINDLTGKSVTYSSSTPSSISVNDIVFSIPIQYNGAYLQTGHAAVVTSMEMVNNMLVVHTHDGCTFARSFIAGSVNTSSLTK